MNSLVQSFQAQSNQTSQGQRPSGIQGLAPFGNNSFENLLAEDSTQHSADRNCFNMFSPSEPQIAHRADSEKRFVETNLKNSTDN